MIIKVIDEILERNSNNLIKSNKERIKLIKENKDKIDLLFNDLKFYLDKKDNIEIRNLLENKMFYEKINNNIIKDITNTYYNISSNFKEELIESLKVSYSLKATSGIRIAIITILGRYKDNKFKVAI